MHRTLLPLSISIVGLLLFVAGCKRDAAKPPAPPPVAVTVANPIRQEILDWDEYTGTLTAVEQVQVRARVSGFLESVHFKEGSMVNKGDLLFKIDPAPFKATYDAVVADQKRAQAQLDYDTAEFKRISDLSDVASPKELEDARLAMRRSQAALDTTRAQVESARLNLDYTSVTAPIAGRIGNYSVTAGNLVSGGAGQTTLLTTIVSMNPIYCYFDADEKSVLRYQRLAREHKRVSAREGTLPVWLALADEEGFPRQGNIDFVNNMLDPTTGTLSGRGVFDNSDRQLLPGMFARIRVPGSGRYHALLIPDTAVQTDQDQKYVYVLDNGKAVYRHIELGSTYGNLRVVAKGLGLEDQVVINGFSRLRPGVAVKATVAAFPTTQARTAPGSPTTQQLPTAEQLSGTATRPATTQPSEGVAR
jgi:RND family efflux transporter MFP subunit